MAKKTARKASKSSKKAARPAAKPAPRSVFKSVAKPARRPQVAAVVESVTIIQTNQPSFKQRVARLLGTPATGGSVDADQLAEVRQGVMDELRKHGSSQPFENVLLPQPRRQPLVPGWALGTVAALALLGGLVWWASRPPAAAELALHSIESAVAAKNTAAFERLVDVPALSTSIVSQVFTAQGDTQTADRLMSDQFEASVRAHLQSFFKPGSAAAPVGLADNLRDQMLAAVSAGQWPQEPGNLLGQLWQQLGGERLHVGHPRPVVTSGMATPNHIEAELPLSRDDIALDVALRLVLEKHDGHWQLVDIPNLAQAMGLVDDAEAAAGDVADDRAPAAGPLPHATEHEAPVLADVLQAAKDNHGHVVARINLANVSGLPVHGLDLALIIGDADGRPLKQTLLHEAGALAPTQSREQTYSVALNTKNPHEAMIAKLPLTALTVRVNVVGVAQ